VPGSDLAVMKVDLADLTSMDVKGQEAAAIFGCVDILINNAGVSYRGSIEDTEMDVHTQVMAVNYFGQIALTKSNNCEIIYFLGTKFHGLATINMFMDIWIHGFPIIFNITKVNKYFTKDQQIIMILQYTIGILTFS